MSRFSEPPPSPSRRFWLVAFSAALVAWLVWTLRPVVVPLVLAFVLAYALDPVVDRLQARGVRRGFGASLVLGSLLVVLAAAAFFVIPYLVDEIGDAASKFPQQFAAFHLRAEAFFWDRFHVRLPHTWGDLVTELTGRYADKTTDVATQALGAIVSTLGALRVAVSALVVPVLALYLLIDFDRMIARMRVLVPRRWSTRVETVAREVHGTLGGYVRGQLLACLILGSLYATTLSLVGIRLAIVIGVLTGLFAFVPYVGFSIGLLLALAMAVLDWHGVDRVVAVFAAMGAVQGLDAMIVTPRVVGKSVGLEPLEVLLTMAAAGTLFGFVGVLLAVPIGAVVKILLAHGTDAYLASDFYHASAPPPSQRG